MTFKDLGEKFYDLIVALREKGGNLIFVGGCVRDILRKEEPKDFDAEVYGLAPKEIQSILEKFGRVKLVGQTFGVFYAMDLGIEVALPRQETKIGKGHRGFDVIFEPGLSFKEASSRRDLTINSMGYDPVAEEILDPWGGQEDLEYGILRATNGEKFSEDPLRSLRVMQFAARFDMEIDPTLLALCAKQDLMELPKERILEEFKKLLMKGRVPSRGLLFLKDSGLDRFFPELKITKEVCDCLDEGAKQRNSGQTDLSLMMGLLTINMPLKKREAFLERLGVSHKCHKQVTLLHRNRERLLSDGNRPYLCRKVAYDLYASDYPLEHFLAFMEVFLGHRDLYFEMKNHKAFDREKIMPIIKGGHLLKWSKADPETFSKILEKCHEIQLKEELFEAAELWRRVGEEFDY